MRAKISGKESLKKQSQANGYKTVSCFMQNRTRQPYVHRLVAEMFVENPHNYNYVDHIDTNPTNNVATNLRWVKDIGENLQNPLSVAKRINNKKVLQLDRDTNAIIKEWPNAYTAHVELGLSSHSILTCCRDMRRKTSGGYQWRFAEDA